MRINNFLTALFVAVLSLFTAGVMSAAAPREASPETRFLCMNYMTPCHFSTCQDWCNANFPGSYGVCQGADLNCCNCYF